MTTNSRTVAELQVALEAILGELRAAKMGEAEAAALVPMASSLKACADYQKLVDTEIKLRAEAGNLVPGAALKDEIKHRQWHDNEAASQLAREEFGEAAFSKPALLPPAQIEKLGERGKAFVAVASYKPECGKRVVY